MSPPEDKGVAARQSDPNLPHPPSPSDDEHGTATNGESANGESVTSEDDALDAKRMTLLEHLSELRVRLRNAAIVFIVSLIGAFFFVQRFFEFLTRPVRRGLIKAGFAAELNVKGVTEPFWVYMKLAITAGILIASPFILWELWKFVAPGLYKKEKRLAGMITGSTALCFIGGAVFGYAILAEPAAFYMMSLLKSDVVGPADAPMITKPVLMMEDVGNFLMMMLAGCGAAFELPVVISMLGWLGIVSVKGLLKFNKYAVVLSTVLGGILTPSADPFTQLLLAGPLFALYNISILVVWSMERTRKREQEALDKQYEDQDKNDQGKNDG